MTLIIIMILQQVIIVLVLNIIIIFDIVSFPTLTFGSSIDTDSQIVLLQFMSHMENFAYEEGVFRKPGSHSRVEQLIHDLGAQPFDSVIANKNYMAADYASVLKSYFKDLPEPLMLRRHMEAYKQASGKHIIY